MESGERRCGGFGPFPAVGASVVVAAGGGHGRCGSGRWISLRGFRRSVQYQGVAEMK